MLILDAPASKSMSHRTLIGAALASGASLVRNALMSKDIERTMAVLQGAGVPMQVQADGAIAVHGCGGALRGGTAAAPLPCDVHESGTTCRLLTAVLAAGQGEFRIFGAGRMHERPIGALVTVLRELGAQITYEEKPDCPPLRLHTDGLRGGATRIGLDESSQYLSGLLLAAPLHTGMDALEITLGGEAVVSWPYVGLTLQTLEDFGILFRVEGRDAADAPWRVVDWRTVTQAEPERIRFIVPPGRYKSGEYAVEGDWSGASYLLTAGAVGARPVLVRGLRADSLQGDRAMVDILRRMGAQVAYTAEGVRVSPAPLHGITVDMGACPDLVPTVAVAAACAGGTTTITNVAHLRIKESDRIAAPAQELGRVGVRVEEREDGLVIHGLGQMPRVPAGTVFHAHGDHRIAMSCALLGLGGAAVTVDDPTVVRKSFPHFWTLWDKVLQA